MPKRKHLNQAKADQLLRKNWISYLLVGSLPGLTGVISMAGFLDQGLRLGASVLLGFFASLSAALVLAALFVYRGQSVSYIRSKKYAVAAIVCCAFFVGMGTLTLTGGDPYSKTKGESITFDEISLLPNGFFYHAYGTYFLNPEHPPLVKDVATLPFLARHTQTPPIKDFPSSILLQDYAQYQWGKTMLFEAGNDTELLILWARMTVLCINAFLIFLLYCSLAKFWSRRAGLIAVFLITVSQFSLAHGVLVTVDFMAAIFTVLGLVWFGAWLKRFADGNSYTYPLLASAAFLSGALLSKFSAILLIPLVGAYGLAYGAVKWKSFHGRRLRYLLALVGCLALVLGLIILVYAYHVRNMQSSDIIAQLNFSYPDERWPEWGLPIFEGLTRLGIFGRALAEFIHGLLMVNNRIYNGASVIFDGQFFKTEGAGPLYFPVLYITKLQLGFHLLSLVALISSAVAAYRIKGRALVKWLVANPMVVLVAAYGIIFGGVAVGSTLQLGIRHIMPAIFCFSVLVALGLDAAITSHASTPQRKKIVRWSAVFVVIAMTGSVLASYPHYLSYYNVMGGGTDKGHEIAVDSNYDWGQDLKALAAWQQQNNVPDLRFDLFVNPFLPRAYYLGPQANQYDIASEPPLESGTYLAVSATRYYLTTTQGQPPEKQYSQFDDHLVQRIGKSIFLYRIP